MLPRSSRESSEDLRFMSDGGVGVLGPLPGVGIRRARVQRGAPRFTERLTERPRARTARPGGSFQRRTQFAWTTNVRQAKRCGKNEPRGFHKESFGRHFRGALQRGRRKKERRTDRVADDASKTACTRCKDLRRVEWNLRRTVCSVKQVRWLPSQTKRSIREATHGMMLSLFAAASSFNAPTSVVSQSAVTTVGRPLAARPLAVPVMCAEPSEDVPELIAPPSRPASMMTESERRRSEPVHSLKHKRRSRKLRDEEGDLVKDPEKE